MATGVIVTDGITTSGGSGSFSVGRDTGSEAVITNKNVEKHFKPA